LQNWPSLDVNLSQMKSGKILTMPIFNTFRPGIVSKALTGQFFFFGFCWGAVGWNWVPLARLPLLGVL
jgi:hypothetical protein